MLPTLQLLAMVVGLIALGAAQSASAQPQPQPPAAAPGAEVQKLGAFLGEWRMKEDPPDSPNRTICQWASNGRSLLCDQVHPGANGQVKELNIFTYDRADHAYVMHGLQPLRRAPFAIDGQTWTYAGDERVEQGKTIKNRVLNVWESPAVMHFLVQSSSDGGTQWKTNFEGRLVRTRDTPGAGGSSSGSNGSAAAGSALDPLVGTWRLTGEHLSAVSTCVRSPNGAFVVCDQLAGDTDLLAVYSLSDEAAAAGGSVPIRVRAVDADGHKVDAFEGTVRDRVWTYTTSAGANAGAAQERVRITRTFTAGDTIRGKEERSRDGSTWVLRAEWTETKEK